MHELALLSVPLLALVSLTVVGAGAAVALAPRLPRDAQAALAPVVGAALVAVASVLVPFGVPPRPLAVGVAVLGAAVTIVSVGAVSAVLRAGAAALVIAVCAVALAGAPSIARGDWGATSLYGSTDAYHWSSQARSYLDGPPPLPVSDHPDRLSYERSKDQSWAFALPFGTLALAWVSGDDPAAVYSAIAAVVFALLPLAAFACARACFEWRRRWAIGAALLLVADTALLYATHFSWQQQLAGTAFVFGAVTALRLSLEPSAARGEPVLAGLLAAAAIASYRLGFTPYFVTVIVVVAFAYAWTHRDALERLVRPLAVFAVALAVLAGPSIAAIATGFGDYVSSGGFSTAHKDAFPHGQIAEALGLMPHLWALEADWPSAATIAWLVAASVLAVALLGAGAIVARKRRIPRADFLAAGAGLTLVGYVVFLVPLFTPYLTYKVLAYGAPFLVLLALSPLVYGGGRLAVAGGVAAVALVVPSAIVATTTARDDLRTTEPLEPLSEARVPVGDVVSVPFADPWDQALATYFLRDHRLSVERPSFILTGEGQRRDPAQYRHRPVQYFLVRMANGMVVLRPTPES